VREFSDMLRTTPAPTSVEDNSFSSKKQMANVNSISENLPSDAQRFGNAVVIEWRYVSPILVAIDGDGLTVRCE